MLNYRTYYQDGYCWFELIEVNPRLSGAAALDILFRRRYRTPEEAQRCGQQALEHTIQLRRERAEKAIAFDEC